MRSRIKQSGSATHIIIVTVLLTVLLGLLGFVFWQNFTRSPEAMSQNTSHTSTSQKSLAIESLGITISYPESEDTYSLSTDSQTGFQFIQSKKAADACNDDGNIGYVSKIASDEYIQMADAKAIDYYKQSEFLQVVEKEGYLYVYTSPQSACADITTETGKSASKLAEDAYKAFALHFQKLTLN
jgi:hypothetical protein